MTPTATLSVVIPTYNRLDRWPALLESLARQTRPADTFEVVVVCDGSSDGTDDYLRAARMPFDLVLAMQANAGPAAARNKGVALAQGSLLLFLDDDIVAAPHLLEQHVESHRTAGDRAVVIGPMANPVDFALTAPIRWEQAMLYKQYESMRRGDYLPSYRQFFTANASLSREAFLSLGGFDIRFRRAEDVEFAFRLHEAGYRFLFNSKAIGYHYAVRSFASWLQNAHDYGVNDVRFARVHPGAGTFARAHREFGSRHPLVRWATRVCTAKPSLRQGLHALLKSAATVSDRLRADCLTRVALSGVYNLAYYSGMADELGSVSQFRELVINPSQNR
jgi:GT2 family glycosyltransferase